MSVKNECVCELFLSKIYWNQISYLLLTRKILQPLFIELFKVKRNLSNNIMSDIFSTRKISGNLRSETDLVRNCINAYINYLIYINIPRYT